MRSTLEALTRERCILDIGYDRPDVGFDGATAARVLDLIGKQSPDINQGVDRKHPRRTGRGRPGTDVRLRLRRDADAHAGPSTTRIACRAAGQGAQEGRRWPWLRPDAKSQVTLRYADGKAVRDRRRGAVDPASIRRSKQKDLIEAVSEEIIKPVLPEEVARRGTKFHINPTGKFVIGGPDGDCGLTGRKIIVDTYGGWARTAAARSRARIRPRSTARPPTRHATSPRTSSRPASPTAARCRSPTRSASRARRRSR
jgi:S-adenosylmethionine synthetase